MWATFKRDEFAHYGNTTNNCLESHIQKLKDVTSRTSTLSEMFENVIFAQTSEDEYKHSSFTEEFKTTKSTIHYDIGEHFLEVKAACTQYAATIIAVQMKLALSVKYMISQREEMMEVKSPNESVYVVKLCHDTGGSVCSCAFYKTMCIPCRHIFSARHFLQLPLFLASMVPQRWLKQYQLCVDKSLSKMGEQCDSREVNLSTFTKKHFPPPHYLVVRNSRRCYLCVISWQQLLPNVACQNSGRNMKMLKISYNVGNKIPPL